MFFQVIGYVGDLSRDVYDVFEMWNVSIFLSFLTLTCSHSQLHVNRWPCRLVQELGMWLVCCRSIECVTARRPLDRIQNPSVQSFWHSKLYKRFLHPCQLKLWTRALYRTWHTGNNPYAMHFLPLWLSQQHKRPYCNVDTHRSSQTFEQTWMCWGYWSAGVVEVPEIECPATLLCPCLEFLHQRRIHNPWARIFCRNRTCNRPRSHGWPQ